MKNPYLQLVFFSISIMVVTCLYMLFGNSPLSPISWLAFGFFVLLTAAVYSILSPSLKTNGKQFVNLFMSTQGLRMFFSLGFLILYLLFAEKREVTFIIYFLLLYLSFTGFEIYLLLSNLRADLKKESTQ